jgi:hypothetical protein
MFLQKNIGVKGKFKFQVFNESSLCYETEKENFITSTGLSYPSQYAFADCFRFVSLGIGTTPNTVVGLGTTGLSTGVSSFSYIGGYDCSQDQNGYYASQYCGFEEEGNIVSLSRGWRVPTTGTFDSDYTFQEFMVSPGYPGVKAIAGDVACGCGDSNTDGNVGTDGSPVAQSASNPYTISICSGYHAFARVLVPISVNQSNYIVVSYKLELSFDSGVQTFNIPIDLNNLPSTNFFGHLTGRANQVHHGLKLVWDEKTYDGGSQQNIDGDFYGESFVGPWGAPMEPSCPASSTSPSFGNLTAFVSTDNIQFLVNREEGGNVSDKSSAAANGLGLMDWHPTPTEENGGAFLGNFYAVRQGGGGNSYYPLDTDYTLNTTSDQLTSDQQNFIVNAKQCDSVSKLPMNNFTPSDRSRSINFSFQFNGINWADGTNVSFVNNPIRALTLSYYDSNSNYIPFYDIIFADLIGLYPSINTSAGTYQLPNESYSDFQPPTGYFYGQDGGTLTVGFLTTWSSPCDPSVIGCPS